MGDEEQLRVAVEGDTVGELIGNAIRQLIDSCEETGVIDSLANNEEIARMNEFGYMVVVYKNNNSNMELN